MVLKLFGNDTKEFYQFENDVKTYGTQTHCCLLASSFLFENDVKTYGTQTIVNH